MPSQGPETKEREGKQYHDRQYVLTEADAELIKAIVESVMHVKSSNCTEHECRFEAVNPDDLEEAVKFYRKFNEAMDDSKSVVRRTIITLIVGGVSVLLGVGFWANIKKTVGI